CSCPIWVSGSLGKDPMRQSLDTSNWELAQFKVREMETGLLLPTEEKVDITVTDAVERYLKDAKARNLTATTISKLKVLTEQLKAFCKEKGFTNVRQLEAPDTISEFRETWKDAPISGLKKFERLRSFFKFCVGRKWLDVNPVLVLKAPKVRPNPTLPFSREEMEKLLWACELFGTGGQYRSKNRTRSKAMVLLLRYSGLRIQDAVTLQRERIQNSKLFLYSQKTGVPVTVALPKIVVSALDELDDFTERFFWNGQGKVTSVVGVWERAFARLFTIAGIKDGHAHRFRDTFAVELLLSGASLEHVSVLLGHSSVKITERHYAPWVQARQDQLDEIVRRAWD